MESFLIKILSAIAITVSGIIGVTSKTKTRKNKLTKSGWILISIIVFTSILASVIEYLEFKEENNALEKEFIKEKKEVEARSLIIKQNTNVLHDVQRVLTPIDEFSVDFEMDFPLNEPFAADYKIRIEKLRAVFKGTVIGTKPELESEFTFGGGTNNPKHIWEVGNFSTSSKFFPNDSSELLVRQQLSQINFRFGIIRDSISFEQEFAQQNDLRFNYDLRVPLRSGFRSSENELNLKATLYTKREGITIRSQSFISSNRATWNSTGKIIGIVDLIGSYMIITNGSTFPKSEVNDNQRQLLFNFSKLRLRFAPGMILKIPTSEIKTFRFRDSGFVVKFYEFPRTSKEFETLMDNSF